MRCGLIGHPLGHSMSPEVHLALAAAKGRALEYRLYDIAPAELPQRLPALLALDGLNVTIPYKQAVLPYLAALGEEAALYRSVNTVVCGEAGAVGHNTDCTGFIRALGGALEGVRTAAVVGAGGVGRMFAIELARRGVAVTIGARESSLPRARALAEEITARFGPAAAAGMDALNAGGAGYGLLINASPCGMFPDTGGCPVSEALVAGCGFVFDSIYNPAATRLILLARRLGVPAAAGGSMLVWQAAAAQEYWCGARFTQGEVADVIHKIFDEE